MTDRQEKARERARKSVDFWCNVLGIVYQQKDRDFIEAEVYEAIETAVAEAVQQKEMALQSIARGQMPEDMGDLRLTAARLSGIARMALTPEESPKVLMTVEQFRQALSEGYNASDPEDCDACGLMQDWPCPRHFLATQEELTEALERCFKTKESPSAQHQRGDGTAGGKEGA